MLDKHYAPTSLVTAISGMRRFYEMFPELQPFRLEIPSRMPRKRSIIDVYSEEEQNKISVRLFSPNISRRDAAICLLSFETGLRSVDICNLRLRHVDWKHDTIHIVQSKTQRPINLPLRTSYEATNAYFMRKSIFRMFHSKTNSTITRLICSVQSVPLELGDSEIV